MKKINYITVLLVASTLLFACKKKEGCMEADASNYDADAKKDDESCRYKTKATIYLGEETGLALADSGIVYTVDVYVNDEWEWSISPSEARSTEPECADANDVVYVEISDSEKQPTVNIRVEDINNKVWYDQDVKMSEDCNLVKI